jgi:hypothetical protein
MSIKQRLNLMNMILALGLATMIGFYTHEMEVVYTSTNYSNAKIIPSMLHIDEALYLLRTYKKKEVLCID